jgi:hypothetical protein
VFDRSQTTKQIRKLVIGEGERISTTDEDIPHLGVLFDIGKSFLPMLEQILRMSSDHAGTGAITTVRAAETGGEEKNPVRIPVNQPPDLGGVFLGKRIVTLAARLVCF